MSNLQVTEIKAFVPALDFERSKRFYQALGFEIPWSSDDLAYVRHGHGSFLLQAFAEEAHARSFQMHMQVENADDWYALVRERGLVAEFGVAASAPEDRPWAMRDFTLTDPSGVLWRIAHLLEKPVDP